MPSSKQSIIPRAEHDIPGFPGLAVCVYGVKKAANLQQQQEQGYFVTLNGQKMIRAEMLDAEKQAVRDFLQAEYPEHFVI